MVEGYGCDIGLEKWVISLCDRKCGVMRFNMGSRETLTDDEEDEDEDGDTSDTTSSEESTSSNSGSEEETNVTFCLIEEVGH
ncbi:hypothetical protein, partial [Escherichia coli]|uniref:hypothetical protein n=1 Tax=Escherichia coli TaxID=562 RepID=UPI001AD8D312